MAEKSGLGSAGYSAGSGVPPQQGAGAKAPGRQCPGSAFAGAGLTKQEAEGDVAGFPAS